eukprot:CAMPEP_0177686892 /NCGR_PEP_ID=MMETSP0447-20121125/33818_1 /TAXON_ID=0 /ORGANISM="Stygamoeba regulata, Strain BSH-02190019" /LENGTH=439 /DNA_ID=CAMNT_0019197059 /DNA_START=180 /DNA_END=1499 /DNA_ORIENTATION=-
MLKKAERQGSVPGTEKNGKERDRKPARKGSSAPRMEKAGRKGSASAVLDNADRKGFRSAAPVEEGKEGSTPKSVDKAPGRSSAPMLAKAGRKNSAPQLHMDYIDQKSEKTERKASGSKISSNSNSNNSNNSNSSSSNNNNNSNNDQDVVVGRSKRGSMIARATVVTAKELFCAVDRSDYLKLGRLLAEPALNVNVRNCFDETPLLRAVGYGSVQAKRCACMLIERGADVNAASACGYTPLHMVCGGMGEESEARVDLCKMLILMKAKVNAMSDVEETPLHMAAFRGRLPLVQLLIESGAEPNRKEREGFTPLFYAAMCSATKCLDYFFSLGADINATTLLGERLLHAVLRTRSGTLKCLVYLMKRGATLGCRRCIKKEKCLAVVDTRLEIIHGCLDANGKPIPEEVERLEARMTSFPDYNNDRWGLPELAKAAAPMEEK